MGKLNRVWEEKSKHLLSDADVAQLTAQFAHAYPSTPPTKINVTTGVFYTLFGLTQHTGGLAALDANEAAFHRALAASYCRFMANEKTTVTFATSTDTIGQQRITFTPAQAFPLTVKFSETLASKLGVSPASFAASINMEYTKNDTLKALTENKQKAPAFSLYPTLRDLPVMLALGARPDGSCHLDQQALLGYQLGRGQELQTLVERMNEELTGLIHTRLALDADEGITIDAATVKDIQFHLGRIRQVMPHKVNMMREFGFAMLAGPTLSERAKGFPELEKFCAGFDTVVAYYNNSRPNRIESYVVPPEQLRDAIALINPPLARSITISGHSLEMPSEKVQQLFHDLLVVAASLIDHGGEAAQVALRGYRAKYDTPQATVTQPTRETVTPVAAKPAVDPLAATDRFMQPLAALAPIGDLVIRLKAKPDGVRHKIRGAASDHAVHLLRFDTADEANKAASQLDAFLLDFSPKGGIHASMVPEGRKPTFWVEITEKAYQRILSIANKVGPDLERTGKHHLDGEMVRAEGKRAELEGYVENIGIRRARNWANVTLATEEEKTAARR